MKIARWSVLGLCLLLIGLASPAKETGTRSYEIREYRGLPCLWWNGLPYFGRFDGTGRDSLDLAGSWRFAVDPGDAGEGRFERTDFDDSAWSEVAVPSVWNTAKSEWSHYEGAAWYRRTFRGPAVPPSGLARLCLDGVIMSGKVWLNGAYLGEHRGGYAAFSLDATGALRAGDNLIAIRVDNRRGYADVPPKLWEAEALGWWPYGGLARSVGLETGGPAVINKVVVRARPEGDGGTLSLAGLVYNHGGEELTLEVAARFGEGAGTSRTATVVVPPRDCARFDLDLGRVGPVARWSPSSPQLYPVTVSLQGEDLRVDEVVVNTGFRSFEVKDGELLLNGEPYWLRGINRHEDDPVTGLYQSDARLAEDLALLKELHVNHLRPGHYPNDPRLLDLCDREGITVTEEIPLYQASSGAMKWVESKLLKGRKNVPRRVGGGYKTLRQMNDPELIENASLQLIEMIERDRNHPSVIMWSVGNENFTFLARAREMYEELIAVCRRFDPERPVTFSLLCGPYVSPALERTGDLADVISLNEYWGWYFGEVDGLGPMLDAFHDKYPDKPIIVSEFGAGAVRGRHADPPEKFSEEYQVYIYERQYAQMLERPYVKGAMPWILADFRCPWFKEEHPVYEINLKGVVDYERNKKAAFFTLAEIYSRVEGGGRSPNPDPVP